jgi:5-methylcytosine-specific restriction endonuclease McrA
VVNLRDIDIARVVVYAWDDHVCPECGSPGPVIQVRSQNGRCGAWLLNNVVGRFINERFDFYYREYSSCSCEPVFMNHCPVCGATKSDTGITRWITGIEGQTDPYLTIECRIQLPRITDRDIEDQVPFHIHHVDMNPGNNSRENLVILCSACHAEVHRQRRHCPGNSSIYDFLNEPPFTDPRP